jgi:hypothetical protein
MECSWFVHDVARAFQERTKGLSGGGLRRAEQCAIETPRLGMGENEKNIHGQKAKGSKLNAEG